MRQLLSFLTVLLIGMAVGFLALFLWYYGLAIAAAVIGYLSVVYYRRGQLARTGVLLAAAGGTYGGLLVRIFLSSLADPAIGIPTISLISMWLALGIAAFGIALVVAAVNSPSHPS
jgi:hypothetical protein